MKDELITFETAKLAKEKGCELELLSEDWTWVDKHGDTWTSNSKSKPNQNVVKVVKCTQSLLQKWLREEHGILVIPDYNVNLKYYFYWVVVGVKTKACSDSYAIKTWEKALEKGLQEALKLI